MLKVIYGYQYSKKFQSENLTPEEYLKLTGGEKLNIKSSSIIPPRLGEPKFGFIRVDYAMPIYKVKK